MAVCWFCVGFFYLMNVVAYIFNNFFPLILISTYAWIPITFFMALLIYQVSRDNIDYIKMLIIGSLVTLLIYTSVQPNSTILFPLSNGGWGWDWNENFKIATILITALVGIMWLYYCIKIYINSPKSLKKYALWLLIGGILIGFIPLILFITNLLMVFLGSDAISISIGALICSIIVSHQPRLLFILPFRTLNLTIIDTYSGLPLYKYNFDSKADIIDQMLFSGMMQGISSILREAVHQGDVNEIHLSKGRLIIHAEEDAKLIFVLVTTHSSYMLTEALNDFAKNFITKFHDSLASPNNITEFNEADDLIKHYFSFVPKYD
jgi:hypothetical protein